MNQPERATVEIAATPVCVPIAGGAEMTEATADSWHKVCALEAIPRLGARVVKSARGNIAVFRTADDEVFALADKCPHKGGPLSQGIVFGRKVACPLHGWNIGLDDGKATAPDVGCTRSYAVKIENGLVYLNVGAPPTTVAIAQ
jgi:nitrite reductase (NADH) small subunit